MKPLRPCTVELTFNLRCGFRHVLEVGRSVLEFLLGDDIPPVAFWLLVEWHFEMEVRKPKKLYLRSVRQGLWYT